jgi:hypothetical protein
MEISRRSPWWCCGRSYFSPWRDATPKRDLERLGARGLPVSGIAAHLARKRGKN